MYPFPPTNTYYSIQRLMWPRMSFAKGSITKFKICQVQVYQKPLSMNLVYFQTRVISLVYIYIYIDMYFPNLQTKNTVPQPTNQPTSPIGSPQPHLTLRTICMVKAYWASTFRPFNKNPWEFSAIMDGVTCGSFITPGEKNGCTSQGFCKQRWIFFRLSIDFRSGWYLT